MTCNHITNVCLYIYICKWIWFEILPHLTPRIFLDVECILTIFRQLVFQILLFVIIIHVHKFIVLTFPAIKPGTQWWRWYVMGITSWSLAWQNVWPIPDKVFKHYIPSDFCNVLFLLLACSITTKWLLIWHPFINE